MTLKEITDTLSDYIRERFEIGDDPDFSNDVNLFDYGFIDSVEATEVIAYLEEHFKVEITQKDIVLYPMNTVSEIAAVVAKKLS